MIFNLGRMLRRVRRQRSVGLLMMLILMSFSILGNALTFFLFERTVDSSLSFADSLWYSLISITTIGYGDFSATTLGARIGTLFFIVLVGLIAFTSAAGMLVDWIMEFRDKERSGMAKLDVKNHLLIIHFPNAARVRHIVEEFLSDPSHKRDEIIIVTDSVATLPFTNRNVSFVRGSPLEEETFLRASIQTTDKAIILSTDYNDPNTDSIVASVAHVINHLNPQVSIIAEVLDPKHDILFHNVDRVSLVYTTQMANNLLIQEAQDPGVNLLTQAITSNQMEGTLASTRVESFPSERLSYNAVAKRLLDDDISLVGVIRGQAVYMKFADLFLTEDDLLVYISGDRHQWSALRTSLF
jgi:voltage-gated potassium channel